MLGTIADSGIGVIGMDGKNENGGDGRRAFGEMKEKLGQKVARSA